MTKRLWLMFGNWQKAFVLGRTLSYKFVYIGVELDRQKPCSQSSLCPKNVKQVTSVKEKSAPFAKGAKGRPPGRLPLAVGKDFAAVDYRDVAAALQEQERNRKTRRLSSGVVILYVEKPGRRQTENDRRIVFTWIERV